MGYRHANKKFTFNVFISKLDFSDCIILIAVLFLASISIFLIHQYKGLQTQNSALEKEKHQINQIYSEILNNVDIAAENNDIESVKKAIYVVYDKIDNVTVKILANAVQNASDIANDIRNLPYKKNLNQIKIKSMAVTETKTENGTNVTFGVGGRYFPWLKNIEMYQYYPEGLIHEDCHHVHFDNVTWDDWKTSEVLYNQSTDQDFVSDYAKTDFLEDFAETCEYILTNKTISNSSILQKKVELVKKYV